MSMVDSQPCLITEKVPSEHHHWRSKFTDGGSSLKPSDYFTIPLHFDYHLGEYGIHQLGIETWLKMVGLTEFDIWRKFGELWGIYTEEFGII